MVVLLIGKLQRHCPLYSFAACSAPVELDGSDAYGTCIVLPFLQAAAVVLDECEIASQ